MNLQSKLGKLSINPYIWIFFTGLIILMPLFLFGSLTFYGDDLNSYKSINSLGFSGSIQNWLNEYGAVYRPIGISIFYSYYAILPENSFLLYLLYQLIYIFTSFILFRQVYFLTKDFLASIFIALFFLFFPFNSVAYWQISSLYMVIAILASFFVIKNIAILSGSESRLKLIFYLMIWLLLLLTYEQVLGLAAALGVIIFLINYNKSTYKTLCKTIFSLIALSVVSTLFLVTYFLSEGNPKVVTLKSINMSDSITQELNNPPIIKHSKSRAVVNNKNTQLKEVVEAANLMKIEYFFNRLKGGVNFLALNVNYSLHKLISLGYLGYFVMMVIIFLGALVLFIPQSFIISTSISPFAYIVVGFLWALGTLAPFFLYDKVHIPPYTLMLPSIGLGIFLYGLLRSVAHIFSKSIFNIISKSLLISIVTIFPLIQYGYYFGLKEELQFWDNVADEINQKNIKINQDLIIISNIVKRDNSHIFWLEKAIGMRYVSDKIERKIRITKVLHKDDILKLTFSDVD
jgi:hypothetical protein